MKKGWEIKKLGDICDSYNGLWKGKKEPFVKVGVIRNTNFTKDCLLDFSDIAYLDVEEKQYVKRKLQKGDLIIEKSGGGPKQPVGRAILFEKEDGEFSFSNFTSVLRLKDSNIDYHFLHKYLYFIYINGETEKMQSHIIGIRNLDFDKYKEFPIPIPPLSEQQRIVSVLDAAFAKIEAVKEKTARNLQNAKELFQSELQKCMSPQSSTNKKGWEIKKLGEVAEIGDGIHGTPMFDKDGLYAFINGRNLINGKICIDENTQLVNINEYNKYKIPFNEKTVFLSINGTIGNRALYHNEKIILGKSAAYFNIKSELLQSHYLYYLLDSTYSKNYFLKSQTGLTIRNLGLKALREYEITIPPLSKQQQIVSRLDMLSAQVKQLEANYKVVLANCEELKQSVLAKVFNGDI